MSTNYYAVRTEHNAASPDDESLHIGKQSGGWDFLFQAHPVLGITDCESWREHLAGPGVRIVDEYGTGHTLDEFWPGAVMRPTDCAHPRTMRTHASEWRSATDPLALSLAGKQWVDRHGHPFADYEFC